MEQDGPGAAVRFDVGGTLRGGRAGLRNRSADFGGAMRSADLWAARRSERPWREPPAYADRMSKNAGAFYSDSGDSCMTGLLRACIYGGGVGCMSTGIEGESAGAGISGSMGSLGRARTFRRSG